MTCSEKDDPICPNLPAIFSPPKHPHFLTPPKRPPARAPVRKSSLFQNERIPFPPPKQIIAFQNAKMPARPPAAHSRMSIIRDSPDGLQIPMIAIIIRTSHSSAPFSERSCMK
jgi:hypothetical protein